MDVFDLVAKITLDSSEYEEQAKKISDDAEKGSGWGGKIKQGLGGIAKAGGIAFGAVATAATAAASVIGKTAFDNYAEYEQLVGGVKKLFGAGGKTLEEYAAETGQTVDEASASYNKLIDSQMAVFNNADKAYKTAGMSANEYMETATSFSAALIQSLGGDTQKAAELTDVAIGAMADNVNTFGGDIDSIKTAYAGFAKQNYTMLDNLKLGYGGTKQEMQRLIKDANKYRKAQGKNADLTIESYADIIEAIQTVQEEQGIAGTTAKEAMTTIEGSAAATKAAWNNVLTAIADGQELDGYFDDLIESLFGANEGEGLLNQVIPTIQRIFEGVGEFVAKASPFIAQKLPELIKAILPSLLTAVGSLLKSLGAALPGLLKAVWDSIKAAAPQLLETIKSMVAGIPGALAGIITSVGDWVKNNKETILAKGEELFGYLKTGVETAISTISDVLGNIGSAIAGWVLEHGEEIVSEGVNLFNWLIAGIKRGILTIGEKLGAIITGIADWINGKGGEDAKGEGGKLLEAIFDGLKEMVSTSISALWDIIKAIGSFFMENRESLLTAGKNILGYIFEGIKSIVSDIGTALIGLLSAAGTWVVQNYKSIFEIGKSIVGYIVEGIVNAVKTIASGFVDFISNISGWFTEHKTEIEEFGNSVITWIADGINNFVSHIKDGFVNVISTIWSWMTSVRESFKNVGKTIIANIKTGIIEWIDKLAEWVKDLPGKIKNAVISLWEDFKGIGGKIIDAILEGLSNLGTKVKEAVEKAVPKTIDVGVAAKVSTQYDEHGQKVTEAKSQFTPRLFPRATLIGKYQDKNYIAGEAEPEMLLGVNKLNRMMYESVQGGMTSVMGQMYDMVKCMQNNASVALEQEIVNVLNAYLPQLASMQVVMDSGALVGAVAPGVDSALGGTASNKRRYNA